RQVLEPPAALDPQLRLVVRAVELWGTDGPAPYTESRSYEGVRVFGDCSGAVGTPSVEVVSDVMSWSRNCPMNVLPAACVVLFGLPALRAGSVIRRTGPAAKLSCASRRPPGLPMSTSDARNRSSAGAKGGRSGNIRPNTCGLVCA